MTTKLFTYGTLMDSRIWQRVTHQTHPATPATLSGHKRLRIIGDDYPVLLPANKEDTVQGVVYSHVSAQQIMLLDAYEGDYYDRQTVYVQQPGPAAGNPQTDLYSAQAYVLKPTYYHLADHTPWCFADFQANQYHSYCQRHFAS